MNQIIDRNSQVIAAARHQIRHSGVIVLLTAIGFLFFAMVAYVQFEQSFLPYFFGFMGTVLLVGAVLRLSRKEQYPKVDENRS
jgi:hypothetical protein